MFVFIASLFAATAALSADRPFAPFEKAKWIGPAASTRPEVDFGGARWISSAKTNLFSRRFVLHAAPTRACEIAFAARNRYYARLNGTPLAACYWEHDHDWRFVRTLDAAQWLRAGENELSFEVDPFAGEAPALIARLDCDGRRIVTDGSWGDVDVGGSLREVRGGDTIRSRRELFAPMFERRFFVRGTVSRAALSITGLGFYEARINGDKVGDKVLDPSFTDYTKRVLYSVYDVSGMLRPGTTNSISVLLGHGWYDHRSLCVWQFEAAPWRDFPRTIAQLDVEYADGVRETVATDASWRQVAGEVVYDDIMEGEIISRAGGGGELGGAEEVSPPGGRLVPAEHPGTKVVRTMRPSSIRDVGNGRWLVEFPENVAGWMRMTLRSQPSGNVVSFTYDERLGEDGLPPVASPWRGRPNIWNGQAADGIRRIDAYFVAPGSYGAMPGAIGALQRDRIVCTGAAAEPYEPRFSYKGYRYVTICGLVGKPDADDIEGCIVSTAFKKTGAFRCSDETFNRLMEAADRSYRSNFVVGFPTDCPHREKNGWTGDAAAAAETAQYLYDNTEAYLKWLRDIADAQRPSGELPGIVPTSGWGFAWGNGPGWDAALPVVAEAIYRHRGDARGLVEAYPALKRLCGFYMREKASGTLVDWGLGDWCAPDDSKMPSVEYTSSCHVMRAHEITALAAEISGKPDDARRLRGTAREIRAAIRAKYMKAPGVFDNGGQTAQGMAVEFGLVEPQEEKAAGEALVAAFEASGGHLTTGIFGMRHSLRALSRHGRADLAFAAISHADAPSLAQFLRDGGTTLWEDWRDRSSRNHVMFCDFAGWAYAHLAGIRPLEPGYARIAIAPEPIGALDFVEASVETPRGRVASTWRRDGRVLRFEFTVPPGSRAEVRLPGLPAFSAGAGRHVRSVALKGAIRALSPSDGTVVPLLSAAQKEFLDMPREVRKTRFDEPTFRSNLVARCGCWPLDVRLSWTNEAPGGCRVTLSRLPDRRRVPLQMASDFSAICRNLEVGRTYEWTVTCGDAATTNRFSTEERAPRLIHDPNVPNVRDLGGRPGLGGRMIRQGRIFRSAGLNENAEDAWMTREEVLAADADGGVRRRDGELEREAERLSDGIGPAVVPDLSGPWECERDGGRIESASGEGDCVARLSGPPRAEAVLRKRFVSGRDGYAVLGCGGDWFWRMSVNGLVEVDRMDGNGAEPVSASSNMVAVPVKRGTNVIETLLWAGDGGFSFHCRAESRDAAETAALRRLTIGDARARLFRRSRGRSPGRTRIGGENRRLWLSELGVKTDIDLRTDAECFGMGGSPLGPSVAWLHLPGLSYSPFVERPEGREAFARVFRELLDESNYPVVIHCISGQDRTGSVAFVLLALLGADEEELFRDWEATAFSNSECRWFNHKKRFDTMWDSFSRLGAGDACGNAEAYARACGISDGDIARFRFLMLEQGTGL